MSYTSVNSPAPRFPCWQFFYLPYDICYQGSSFLHLHLHAKIEWGKRIQGWSWRLSLSYKNNCVFDRINKICNTQVLLRSTLGQRNSLCGTWVSCGTKGWPCDVVHTEVFEFGEGIKCAAVFELGFIAELAILSFLSLCHFMLFEGACLTFYKIKLSRIYLSSIRIW